MGITQEEHTKTTQQVTTKKNEFDERWDKTTRIKRNYQKDFAHSLDDVGTLKQLNDGLLNNKRGVCLPLVTR